VRSDGSDNVATGGVGLRSLDILSGATRRDRRHSVLPSNVMQAVIGVKFIADHMKQQDDENEVYLTVSSSLCFDYFLIVMKVIIMLTRRHKRRQ